jgi:C-terminal processing protease CtpA/Prc
MKTKLLTFAALIAAFSLSAQTAGKITTADWGFENPAIEKSDFYRSFGDSTYHLYLDSSVVHSGKYALAINSNAVKPDFRAWSFRLPGNYAGKQITLSGYFKTEDVTDGFAGLFMRIDPRVAFDNMRQQDIKGTRDWEKFSIILNLDPSVTTGIYIGGLLTGKGKVWFDDIHVSVDGIDLDNAPLAPTFPADQDTAFGRGSGIIFPTLTPQQISNLDLLGKLWGFLKYHHPAISSGNYNWDNELFRVLPGYLKVRSQQERDKLLLTWITKLGPVAACNDCKPTPADAFGKPDLSWVDQSGIGNAQLKQAIRNIYANRAQGEHYYIKMSNGVGNPQFLHEHTYATMHYPDAGFRLLALYRYWSMNRYFFPSTYLTDKDWNKVLAEYIPVFLAAKDGLAYEQAAIKLIGEVGDSHAGIISGDDQLHASKGAYCPPFRVEFIENKWVVTDYYNPELKQPGGPESGDVITQINGQTAQSRADNIRPYYPASNEGARMRDMSFSMLRSADTALQLSYYSNGQLKQQRIKLYPGDSLNLFRYKVHKDVPCYQLLPGNIGYVTLATIKPEDIAFIKEKFKNTRGLIIDIRNYPAFFTPFALGSWFVDKPAQFAKFTQGNANNPGEFTFRNGDLIDPGKEGLYKGKLMVLVNADCQSMAEYTTMALQAGKNTTVVGTTTAGADGNVSTITLPGGISSYISGIGVYYPDGRQTQRIGIVPDVKVERTVAGVKAGRDEVLEKAIELVGK